MMGTGAAAGSSRLVRADRDQATRNRGMPLEALRYDITPTGLHMQRSHFDIPHVAAAGDWHIAIGGEVAHPRTVPLSDLRAMAPRTLTVTLECAGNGRALLEPPVDGQPWRYEAVGTATWTGVPLVDLLDEVAIGDRAVEVVFSGADAGTEHGIEHHYERSLGIEEARRSGALLAYEMNGRPLEPQHGAPVRLIVPGWYGMASVKWLRAITPVTEPFAGYQQAVAYRMQRYRADAGAPVRRVAPRALMVPPGLPDHGNEVRLADAGTITLRGRAWSGGGAITRVEVGIDGVWQDADLDPPIGEHAWRGWTARWHALPGEHELTCRATDAEGRTQPLEPLWNVQGVANNSVQRLTVLVR
jgi:sulfane dehydrogenase subunit SoxC